MTNDAVTLSLSKGEVKERELAYHGFDTLPDTSYRDRLHDYDDFICHGSINSSQSLDFNGLNV